MLFTIYTKPDCSFCTKAKELLKGLDLPYQEFSVNEHITKGELENMIGQPVNTVPVILYSNDTLVGGYTNLQDFLIERDFV